MRLDDLTVFVLNHVGSIAMQHPNLARRQRGGMHARLNTMASSLDTHQTDIFEGDVGMEDAHRIGSTAHAGHHIIRLTTGKLRHLLNGLLSDH